MHLLDIYYRFERLNKTRSKSRLDLVACSQSYEPLQKQNKDWIYSTQSDHIQASQNRKPAFTITGGSGNHITGVFIPEVRRHEIGYGDIKGTTDAALFILAENQLEIFIAKGKKNAAFALFQLLADGELDDEIEVLRKQSKPIHQIDSMAKDTII